MTPLNTIIEEEKKEFEARFCNERICKCCLNKECNHSTTGCPWYQNDVFLHTDNAIQIKAFLTTAMQRAYEAGRADWLRSEIEKLEGMKVGRSDIVYLTNPPQFDWNHSQEAVDGYNRATDSIITRYKEELLELEKGT